MGELQVNDFYQMRSRFLPEAKDFILVRKSCSVFENGVEN